MKYRQLTSLLSLLVLFGYLACAHPYTKGKTDAKEAYLRAHLRTIRQAISSYNNDTGKPPGTLQDLVNNHYLAMIPDDPITEKSDWKIVVYDCSKDAPCADGVKDVHSSSSARSSDGRPYSQW